MNQYYFKKLFYGIVVSVCTVQSGNVNAQRVVSAKHNDRHDLIANVNKVQLDHRRIFSLKNLIATSKESNNRKALKTHKEKLILEKKVLKADYSNAKEQECTYKENKEKKIKRLEEELKASNERYESIRKQIKKDLSNKNDFALQKDAEDLLKAVQVRNETSTELAMEKSDLLATIEAVDEAWRKVKMTRKEPRADFSNPPRNSDLTTK